MRKYLPWGILAALLLGAPAYNVNPPGFNVALNCYTGSNGACVSVTTPALTITAANNAVGLSFNNSVFTAESYGLSVSGEWIFAGEVYAASSAVLGLNGTLLTNVAVGTQGGCSMASTTSCTVAVAGCTTSSMCFSSIQANAATTDATGVQCVCSAGTVTCTAKVGTTGTETFNTLCIN